MGNKPNIIIDENQIRALSEIESVDCSCTVGCGECEYNVAHLLDFSHTGPVCLSKICYKLLKEQSENDN